MIGTNLLDALSADPSLPGAVCAGRWELFDAPEPGSDPDDAAFAERAALRLCGQCPALAGCQAWFDSLPGAQRPLGVVAGQVNRPRPPGRPRRSA